MACTLTSPSLNPLHEIGDVVIMSTKERGVGELYTKSCGEDSQNLLSIAPTE